MSTLEEQYNRNQRGSGRTDREGTGSTLPSWVRDGQNNYPNAYRPNELGQYGYSVYGKGGKLRHQGSFSPNNPYFLQLKQAATNQDKDALYELAVKWEADQAAYQQQLADRQAALDEQRAYDDPSAANARLRAAGINPDIAGSSSGSSSGSSASMALPTLNQTTGQTKFSNAYDNSSLVLQGIGTAASVLSSFTGLGSTIISAIDTLTTLPARAKLLNAQAYVADQSKDAAVTSAKNTAESGILSGIQQSLGILGDVSSFFTPESTDDDITSVLSTLGYSDDKIPSMMSAIRQYHKNPNMKAYFENAKKEANFAEQWNSQYTPEIVGRVISQSIQLQDAQNHFEIDSKQLQARIAKILNTDTHAANVSSSISDQAVYDSEKAALDVDMLRRDIDAYVSNIANIDEAIKFREKSIERINKTASAENRKLTAAEEAIINSHNIAIMQMRALGSNELSRLYTMMRSNARQNYYDRVNMSSGVVEPIIGIEKHNYFTGYTFDDLNNGSVTTDQIVNQLMDIGKLFLPGGSAAKALKLFK